MSDQDVAVVIGAATALAHVLAYVALFMWARVNEARLRDDPQQRN